MRLALLLIWLGGTIWGIGQIIEGIQTGNGGQVAIAIAIGVVATFAISIVFNLIHGKKFNGDERD